MRFVAVAVAVTICLTVGPVDAAVHPQAAESVRTISRVAGAASWVEMHRFAYGTLPVAKTTAELSETVGLEPQFLVDGWGKPLELEIDPVRNHYTIRGSNGISITDGVLQPDLHGWLRKLGVEPEDLGSAVADSKAQRTSFTMRQLAILLEAYATDHNRYPAARDNAHLLALLQPYGALDSLADAWGTELRVVVSDDGATNEIVSAGSDREFDPASWATHGNLTDTRADAVLRKGEFVRLWQERDLSGAVRDATAMVQDLADIRAHGAARRQDYARTIRNSRIYHFQSTQRPAQALAIYATGLTRDPLTDDQLEDFVQKTTLPSDVSPEELQRFMSIAEGLIDERLQAMPKDAADTLLQKIFYATESIERPNETMWRWRARLASLPSAGPGPLEWFVMNAGTAAERKEISAPDLLAAAEKQATRLMALDEDNSFAAGARVELLGAMLEQTTDAARKEELLRALEVAREEHVERVKRKWLEKKK